MQVEVGNVHVNLCVQQVEQRKAHVCSTIFISVPTWRSSGLPVLSAPICCSSLCLSPTAFPAHCTDFGVSHADTHLNEFMSGVLYFHIIPLGLLNHLYFHLQANCCCCVKTLHGVFKRLELHLKQLEMDYREVDKFIRSAFN